MIKRLFIAAGIGLALSGGALADDTAKAGAKAQGAVTGDTTARAIAQCEQMSGAQKSNCLQQAREAADRSAVGGTSGSATGRVGAGASVSQPKDAAPASGTPKAY
jgi:hypothetical protein